MAIDTQSLSQLITEFRALTAKDSITPESLGSILQRISDLLATAGTSETVSKIQELLDGMKSAGYVISSIAQGSTDRNHIYADISKVSLSDGTQTSTSGIFIQQATTERAGAMRAQQVTDLNTAKSNISTIQTNITTLQSRCTSIESSLSTLNVLLTQLSNTVNNSTASASVITCDVYDGCLYVRGAENLYQKYKPYIFRFTRKHNHTKKTQNQRFPSQKGWHMLGGQSVATVDNSGLVKFSRTPNEGKHEDDNHSYTTDAINLLTVNDGKVAWGENRIPINDYNTDSPRLIRLPFAIAFGPSDSHKSHRLDISSLVTNLATFSVLFDPVTQRWIFSK